LVTDDALLLGPSVVVRIVVIDVDAILLAASQFTLLPASTTFSQTTGLSIAINYIIFIGRNYVSVMLYQWSATTL